MSKRTAAVAALVVLALAVVGGWAAWQQTRSVQTTAMVQGTFTLENLTCEDGVSDGSVVGGWNACGAIVENVYSLPMTIVAGTLVADREDVETQGPSEGGPDPGQFPRTAQPGEVIPIVAAWRTRQDATVGAVLFVLSITAEAE